MTDIFDRAATKAIDKLIDVLGIEPRTRTVAYQLLAVTLRGAWHAEHRIAQNDDLSVFADQLVCIQIRHRDAVPAEWRALDVPIEESLDVPVTEFWLVFHNGEREVKQL